MSYLTRKIGYAKGVRVYLEKRGYEFSHPFQLNEVMIEFLKEYHLPYQKWNKRYKGLNTADLVNAETVQDNWDKFKQWYEK